MVRNVLQGFEQKHRVNERVNTRHLDVVVHFYAGFFRLTQRDDQSLTCSDFCNRGSVFRQQIIFGHDHKGGRLGTNQRQRTVLQF